MTGVCFFPSEQVSLPTTKLNYSFEVFRPVLLLRQIVSRLAKTAQRNKRTGGFGKRLFLNFTGIGVHDRCGEDGRRGPCQGNVRPF